jgi:5-methylcytosine-specific restriction enzyme subunit McrC
MRLVTVREREELKIGGSEQELSHAHAAALGELAHTLPRRTFSWEHQAIRVGPYCGVLRIADLTIEILPKVSTKLGDQGQSRGILIAMLRAAGELSATPIGSGPLGFQRFHLLDVFIIDFCQRVNELLRRGAIHSYQPQEENLRAVRGRIHLCEDVRSNLFDRSHIFCRYDEFTSDNVHNQALKAALTQLLDVAVSTEAKGAVNALLLRMARLFETYVGVLIRRAWRGAGPEVILQGPRYCFATSQRFADGGATRPVAAVSQADLGSILRGWPTG